MNEKTKDQSSRKRVVEWVVLVILLACIAITFWRHDELFLGIAFAIGGAWNACRYWGEIRKGRSKGQLVYSIILTLIGVFAILRSVISTIQT